MPNSTPSLDLMATECSQETVNSTALGQPGANLRGPEKSFDRAVRALQPSWSWAGLEQVSISRHTWAEIIVGPNFHQGFLFGSGSGGSPMLFPRALPPSFWVGCWIVIRCPAILAAELILATTEAVTPAPTSVHDSRHWFVMRSYRTLGISKYSATISYNNHTTIISNYILSWRKGICSTLWPIKTMYQ